MKSENNIFICVQESANPVVEAENLGPQPTLVVLGTPTNCKAAFFKATFLACEGTILCKVPLVDVLLFLLATFFVFNMHFTPGCANFVFFLEYFF